MVSADEQCLAIGGIQTVGVLACCKLAGSLELLYFLQRVVGYGDCMIASLPYSCRRILLARHVGVFPCEELVENRVI